MKNVQSHSNAALLSSHGTSAHETGIQFSTLNPYEYFHSQGIDLQDFTVRILQKPRANGVTITCSANISGIIYTVGAASYEGLLAELIDDYRRHQATVTATRRRKKVRNKQSFISRHPEATNFPKYLC